MIRIPISSRPNWEEKVAEQGFLYYKEYYKEDACYSFTESEINNFEKATSEVFNMCCQAMDYLVKNPEELKKFHIPEPFIQAIRESWLEDHVSFYGRFDFAYNPGTGSIKVLEFNADTPTSLLEASVIQWYWLQEYNSKLDQFNSLHEKLVQHLKVCAPYITEDSENEKLFLASVEDSTEDYMTVKYLEECASQAGLKTQYLKISDISIDVNDPSRFCTPDGEYIDAIFKLYPYEWMFHEEFATNLLKSFKTTTWIEPFYKAVWSNKYFMVILHKLFPGSPYILPCYDSPTNLRGKSYVRKPLLSREGANVTIIDSAGDIIESTEGEYGHEGFIYQEYFDIPKHDNKTPIIGSWVIGGEPAGIGIRESDNKITNNMSYFVPHYFDKY